MTEQERAKASAENYQRLRAELEKRLNTDTRLSKISEKVIAGTADFRDTAEYSEIAANHIGAVLQENIGTITNPLGKEYVCRELLRDHYDAINGVLGEVQVAVDDQLGIHLTPKKAPYPSERVQTVAHALEDPTVKPEIIRRRANAPVANVAKSFHDDYIRTNAKLRSDLGLKPVIQRYGTGCCEWCSAVAGKYRFGEQPEDIFRRHDNCNCVIIYDTQVLRGKQTDNGGRSKTWEEIDPDSIAGTQPEILSQEQAENLQNSALQGLTLAGRRDIMRASEIFRKEGDDPMFEVTGRAIVSNPHEVEQMIEQLNQWGVSINRGSNTLGYGCVRNGEPGGMSVSENASYSAWCHEFQHAKDDMEAGWNGLKVLWTDPAERERRERNAYAIEISLANEAGREDIAKRLEENCNAEIEKIWKSYLEYFKD